MTANPDRMRLTSGVEGLDGLLDGGYLPGRTYLVRGNPGTGKSILGMHFLQAGAAAGEGALYISLEEPEVNLRANAGHLGLDLEGVRVLDLSPGTGYFATDALYDVFPPGEVEGSDLVASIREEVDERRPRRVFLDPVTQLRYLAPDPFQFRRQLLAFKRYVTERDATLLLTSQASASLPDDDLAFLSDGIVELQNDGHGRGIDVRKHRGSAVQAGPHALRIDRGGLQVFPRLRPDEHQQAFVAEPIPSGVPELDAMLEGGLERGTVTVLSGPTGVGKTTLGSLFMKEAATRNERSAIYLFEEARSTFLARSQAIGMRFEAQEDAGNLHIQEVEPLGRSAEELAHLIRAQVEEEDVRVVMIDGLAGYRVAIPSTGDVFLRKLHALVRYLRNMGVTIILVDETADLLGVSRATEGGLSYIADNILLLRHVETGGELRKVVGVLKKRTSDFEPLLRELRITGEGVRVGEPLRGLRGILQGVPSGARVGEATGGDPDDA